MKTTLPIIALVALLLNTTVYSNTLPEAVEKKSDSLILKKNNSKKIAVIHMGKRIKVWKDKKTIFKGNFMGIDQNFMILKIDKEEEIKIAIDEIQKIKIIGSLFREITSGAFIAIGVIGIGIGTGFMIALIASSSSYGGAIVAAFAGAIAGIGTPFLVGGNLLSGRKFNLKKKWSIKTEL